MRLLNFKVDFAAIDIAIYNQLSIGVWIKTTTVYKNLFSFSRDKKYKIIHNLKNRISIEYNKIN